MSTIRIERIGGSQAGALHPRSAIVFGSATTELAAKPTSVRATCEAIGLARSTYYYQSHRSASAIELEHKIVLRLHELREIFPNSGYRRMTQQLQIEGFKINRKRIARLMQLHGLTVRPVKCWSEGSRRSRYPTVANLWRDVRVNRPYQAWVADIAYVRVGSTLIYAAAIIDAWTGEIMGYAVSTQINARLTSIALHAAIRAHRPAPGSVHHSNSGAQYAMPGYTELLRQYGLVPSAGDAASEQPSLTAVNCPQTSHSHQVVVEMQGYETWEQVSDQAREFIHALYSPERIARILRQGSAEGPCGPMREPSI